MILVTRNKDKSIILSKELENKGFQTIIWPLFEVVYCQVKIIDKILIWLFRPKVLLITSSNAINYLERLKLNKNIHILSIGSHTTQTLNELGYNNIKTADNYSGSLLDLAKKELSKKDPILYLSSQIITTDLALHLKQEGFKTKKIICYKIKEQKHIEQGIIDKIRNKTITGVTIYSRNTLSIFHKLLIKYNLLVYCREIKLLCLSEAIIKYSKELGFTKSENINTILQP